MIYSIDNEVEEVSGRDSFPTFTEVITWPDSQSLCGKIGFIYNCALINGIKGLELFGCGAYRVNPDWYAKVLSGEIGDSNDDNENSDDDFLVDYQFGKYYKEKK